MTLNENSGMTPKWRIGLLLLCLSALFVLSGCGKALIATSACIVDESLIVDLQIMDEPSGVSNEVLLDLIMEVNGDIKLDKTRKAKLRAQLALCRNAPK